MEKQGAAPQMAYGQPQPPVYHDPNSPPPQGQAYQQPPMQPGYPASPPAVHDQAAYYPPQQVQQPGAPQQFRNVTPVSNLQRGPAPIDCPACGQRGLTNTSFETGNTTHAWALGLCCLACLGCIPYMMSSTKDVQHKCGKCGVLVATWHRSGTTEVHLHS